MLTWQYAPRLPSILIPLTLVVAVVPWWLYRTEVNTVNAITRADQRHIVQLASQTIAAELEMLRGDTLYLGEQTSLHGWLDTGDSAARANLGADLLAFTRRRRLYDQVRFLNDRGREIVRINWNDGQPRLVPANELQDKSGRYYVEKTIALNEGDIYISPFDLNIEKNVVKQPVKPVIRLATPVFDRTGRKRGLIILNYLGERLLGRLREIRSQDTGELWLLNAAGYWMLGPNPEMEWGFMYPRRRAMRFDREHGETWASIQSGPERAQWMRKEGLFTYVKLEPEASPIGFKHEGWVLVAHVPVSTLAANMGERTRSLVTAFIVLALLLTAVSGVMVYKDLQRRRTEARIRESEARFRGLLDSAPDAIVIADQSGGISLVNSQTEKWFGYTRDELLGQPVEQLVPERFRERDGTHREGFSANPLVRNIGAGAELFGLRKDSTEFPVEISLSPLETEQGTLITRVIRDISSRKQAEEIGRRMQARYQDLVTNLPVGVFRTTPGAGGRFLDVNPAMLAIFEAESTEELMAHSVSDVYCDPSELIAVSGTIMRQGHVKSQELRLKTLRRREFYAAITAAVKKSTTGSIYFDGTIEDISERKDSERRIRELNDSLSARSKELEAINRELETFSYSVSHDLRAPLRAIDGFSHILLNNYGERLDDQGKDRLNRVRAAAQRMAALIDDLLKLSRVSRAEIVREPINMATLANEVMETLRRADSQRNVQFSVQLDLLAQGDARLLRIVMDNLLGNAWKFTGQRTDPRIEMGGSQGGTEFIYFVRDNGVGFDMAYADKLFGPFQRLHNTGEFPGTGIGLATVQRVIHKHGGRIWAESAVGKGATFYFTLQPRGHA